MYTVSANDFSSWRDSVRPYLCRNIHPSQISWQARDQSTLDFGNSCNLDNVRIVITQLKISAEFIALAKDVSCHSNPHRWSLLYRVAWRLIFEDKNLLSMLIDDDLVQLRAMQKNISRDKHKMKAFVRFQEMSSSALAKIDALIRAQFSPCAEESKKKAFDSTDEADSAQAPHYFAWFEPDHNIVAATAPFFARRFANMHWTIVTPTVCARWNTEKLTLVEGDFHTFQALCNSDAMEELWLEYYRNIFNPARLKLKAMQAEMPKKYWRNLPEAQLIDSLKTQAAQRTQSMIQSKAVEAWQKTQGSSFVQALQRQLQSDREKSKR